MMDGGLHIRPDPRDVALTGAPDHVKGALASLCHGLLEISGDADPLPLAGEVAIVLTRRLDRGTRSWLLMTAARATEVDDLSALAESIVSPRMAGEPVPAFSSVRDEARDWATFASAPEQRAYLAAIWGRLPERDRARFLKAVRKGKPQ